MRTASLLLLVTLLAIGGGGWVQPQAAPTRFAAIHVYVDSGDRPLAAYQIDIVGKTPGRVRIVGIEGGEHAAFSEPPYYDTAAMQNDRVIIAAFSTAAAETLPAGKTRIATIHVQITDAGEPAFDATLSAAATAGGAAIDARITLETGTNG